MKRMAQVAVAVVAAAIVAVVTLRVTSAATAPQLPVAYGFDGHSGWHGGQIRPHAIYFGAGGSLLVRDITWVRWRDGSAAGRGTRLADNCIPNCAAGTYANSSASLTLWRVRDRAGQRYFSRMTISWTSRGRQYDTVFSFAPVAASSTPFWS
jgi:hypothetical protein